MGAQKWPPFLPTFGAPRRGCGAPLLLLGGGRLTARQAREELPEIARHVVVRLLEMVLAVAAPHADGGDAAIGGHELHLSRPRVDETHLDLRARAARSIGAPEHAQRLR